MHENSSFYWSCRILLGINLKNKNEKPIQNVWFQISTIILFTSGIYQLSVIVADSGSGLLLKIRLCNTLTIIASVLVFFTMQKKLQKILNIVRRLEQLRKHRAIKSSQKTILSIPVLVFLHLLPFFSAIVCLHPSGLINYPKERFSYGFKFENNHIITVLSCLYFYTDCVVTVSYPSSTAFFLCIVLSKCEDLLLYHRKKFRRYKWRFREELTDDVKQYLEIIKIIRQITNTFSIPVFLIVIGNISCLLIVLSLFLLMRLEFDLGMVFTNVFYSGGSCGTLFVLCLYSSLIPHHMSRIKWDIGVCIDKIKPNCTFENDDLMLLKRIEEKNAIHVKVGGFVIIEKSFILSVAGVLFSYGMLLININDSQ